MRRSIRRSAYASLLALSAVSIVLGIAENRGSAVVLLTPGGGATNVVNRGLDTTTGPARPSVAPVMPPELTLLPVAQISVVGTGDLGANYVVGFIIDGTGYNFLTDNASNRGWIPNSAGTETATFTFTTPIRLAGIDFLTLFNNRTGGTFTFDYSLNNQGSWSTIAIVSNSSNADVFRQGFSFDDIDGVTDVRLVTTSTSAELFIGEVDFFTSTVPEPSTIVLLCGGLAGLAWRRRSGRLAN